MTFAYLALTVEFSTRVSSVLDGKELLVNNVFTARIALSLATNAIATLLIAYKLWYVGGPALARMFLSYPHRTHRKFVINNLGMAQRQSKVEKVLVLLVESGVLYCALQVGHQERPCSYIVYHGSASQRCPEYFPFCGPGFAHDFCRPSPFRHIHSNLSKYRPGFLPLAPLPDTAF